MQDKMKDWIEKNKKRIGYGLALASVIGSISVGGFIAYHKFHPNYPAWYKEAYEEKIKEARELARGFEQPLKNYIEETIKSYSKTCKEFLSFEKALEIYKQILPNLEELEISKLKYEIAEAQKDFEDYLDFLRKNDF
ncbi:MAG: hypothetical protein QXQ40_00790 [Candidatus Aenigmatarchaeota archaeon]